MIRLTVPSIESDDLAAVLDVLKAGFLVQGAHVARFERQLADYLGVRETIAVSSGTAALHVALLSLGVGPGDRVVTTAFSWPATANAIELCGAVPVFVDIERQSFGIDQEELDRVLTEERKSGSSLKAVLVVHAFGQMADMAAIEVVARRHALPLIEDAACALGARRDGRQAGGCGILGCFSFHPRKAITTGEGGLVATNDAGLARRIRALRNHGLDPESAVHDFICPGFNYRMTEFQAALGQTQLAKLERILTARRRLAELYTRKLAQLPGWQFPQVPSGSAPTYQSYVVLLPEELACERPALIQRLRAQEIETTIGTWHIPLTRYYRERYGYQPEDFPVATEVFRRALSLPLFEGLPVEELNYVVEQLRALQEVSVP